MTSCFCSSSVSLVQSQKLSHLEAQEHLMGNTDWCVLKPVISSALLNLEWGAGMGGGGHKFYCSQKKDLQINLRAERGGFSPISFTIIVRYSWAPAKLIIHPMNIAGIDDQVLLFRVQSEHSLPPGRTETSEALDKLPSCGEAWFKVKGWHPWAHSVLLLLFFYSTVIGELKAMTSIYFLIIPL